MHALKATVLVLVLVFEALLPVHGTVTDDYNLLSPKGYCKSNGKQLPYLASRGGLDLAGCSDACNNMEECVAFSLADATVPQNCQLNGLDVAIDLSFGSVLMLGDAPFSPSFSGTVDTVDPNSGIKCYVKNPTPTHDDYNLLSPDGRCLGNGKVLPTLVSKINLKFHEIDTISINAAGTTYAAVDAGFLTGGTGSGATYQVTNVEGVNGRVTGVKITSSGDRLYVPTDVLTLGDSGDGSAAVAIVEVTNFYRTLTACSDACTKVYACAAFTLSATADCVLHGVSLSSLTPGIIYPEHWDFYTPSGEIGTNIVDSVEALAGDKCYVKKTPPIAEATTLPPAAAAAAAASAPVQQPPASAAVPQPELAAPSSSSGWSSTDTALTVLGGALAIGIAAGVLKGKKLWALVKRISVPQPGSQIIGLEYAALGSTADLL